MTEEFRKVRPTPTNEYLANPHKGCCTFQHFNGDELFPGTGWSEAGPVEFPARKFPDVTEGYLPSTVSYCRWFWRLMEPQEGQYDFTVIDKALETCSQRGQTLAIRLMAFGAVNQPLAPQWYLDKYPTAVQKRGNGQIPHPVHDSPQYLEHWGNFIREAGRRYDGNPLVESIDITFIGPWGEGDGECSREQCRRFAQLWKEAWPTTPRLALIAGEQMEEGIASGSGWRCDCFGDLSAAGSNEVPCNVSWNHHFDCYPRAVCEANAQEAWKRAPIHFESCWVPMAWYKRGWDIDFIIEQGLKFHGTYLMPKYTRLPEPWMGKLADFCRRLGYHFVLRQAIYTRSVKADGRLRFMSWIENVGVAPMYRRYDFALRLRQGDFEQVVPMTDIDVRSWLPGDAWIDRQVQIPQGFRAGYVELAAGLVLPGTTESKVHFAVKERFPDRWTDLGGIILE